MAPYLGDFRPDATIDFKWSTHLATGGGATRTVNGTVAIYKDNGTTEITTGITDTEDFDAKTGIHHCRIAVTTAGLTPGSDYQVVLTGATVDGEASVVAVLAHFSILNRGDDIVSRGTLDAGSASGFTLPAGKRSGVKAGDAIRIVSGTGQGYCLIDTYNSTTGVGALRSGRSFDVTPVAGDYYEVVSLPSAEQIAAADIADAALTAVKFADGFLTAAKIDANAITSAKIAADAIGASQIAADAIASAKIADGALAASKFADGYLTAAKIATDALSAVKFAADAIAAIQSGLATAAAQTTAQTSLTSIDGRLPAALVAGKIDANLAAAGLQTDAQEAIRDVILDEPLETGHSLRRAIKNMAAVLLGKSSKAGNDRTYRDLLDANDQVVATVDSSGNRTAVTHGS